MPKKSEAIVRPVNNTEGISRKSERLETKLLDNLVQLQKVHTELAEKFDRLAGEISSLLKLFEGAAKTFVSGPGAKEFVKDQEFLDKIDRLIEQNKTIAKGLILMEDRIRDRAGSSAPMASSQGFGGPGSEESGDYVQSINTRQTPKF